MPIIYGKGGRSAKVIQKTEPAVIVEAKPQSEIPLPFQSEIPAQSDGRSPGGQEPAFTEIEDVTAKPVVPSQLDPTPPMGSDSPISRAEFSSLAHGFIFLAQVMHRQGSLTDDDMKDLTELTRLFGFAESVPNNAG